MLEKSFDFAGAEKRIYDAWERSGAFKPSGEGEPFTIVIPPPNVTGSLHMGHALNNTLQDALCRFERMRGRSVLWQPGCDHAGIATQMVVERQLMENQEPSRRDMGREAFVKRVWEWKEESGGTITKQLRRLGASCDWSRERFTMDEGLSAAVRKVFVQLYNEGLIYRDKRLVNWDPEFHTAISDLEVENIEVDGHFWHLKYPLADGATYEFPIEHDEEGNPTKWETRDYIAVATTRPETMLGDTGVAVHPDDNRYRALVSKFVDHPLTGRRIPIIADEHADPEQGSGAVKITPAHDFNDFDVGRRAGLEALVIFNEDATISDAAPEAYRGLDRFVARKRVVEDLDKLGLLAAIEDKKIVQPFGDRSGVVIEPMLTDQWYVNAEVLAKPAIEAVEKGETKFIPENWTKTYYQWMRNIQPWCVSRQLWWGHRIPAWYGPEIKDGLIDDEAESKVFVAQTEEEFLAQAKAYYGSHVHIEIISDRDGIEVPALNDRDIESGARGDRHGRAIKPDEVTVVRDPDVLDTWFSSALWPFSTLSWPDALRDASSLHPEEARKRRHEGRRDETSGPALRDAALRAAPQGEESFLHKHYPTSVLVTAFDIIFFWVARMMMMGLHFMKEVPFHDVYIHALVLDEKGQKMSKSKGNVIDPLVLIDKYGADALRFTLAAQAAQGRNIRLSEARVEGYRNFTTKLWNAARFCEMNGCAPDPSFDPTSAKETVNQWIIHEANACAGDVTRALEAYRFNDAAGAIYRFVWNVFCDWYLELAKPVLQGDDGAGKDETRRAAAWALDQILKLLHPFMPFVTEELWGALGDGETQLISTTWPAADERLERPEAAAEMDWVVRLITAIRSVRAEMNVPAGAKIPMTLAGANKASQARLEAHREVVARLARLSEISVAAEPPKGAVQALHDEATAALAIADVIDIAAERARLEKDAAKAADEIARIDKKLANKNFVERAPAEVVEEQKTRRADYETQREKLAAALKRLQDL